MQEWHHTHNQAHDMDVVCVHSEHFDDNGMKCIDDRYSQTLLPLPSQAPGDRALYSKHSCSRMLHTLYDTTMFAPKALSLLLVLLTSQNFIRSI